MSASDSDRYGTDSDALSSRNEDGGAVPDLHVRDFEEANYFENRSLCVMRNIVFHYYRTHELGQGRSRRSVSGSTGRLLRDLHDADISAVRSRLEQNLPVAIKNCVTRSHDLLQRFWQVPLPDNDREYLRSMGEQCDPSCSEVLQQFQRLFHAAAMERRFTSQQVQTVSDVMSKEAGHMLYLPKVYLLVKSLPTEAQKARQRQEAALGRSKCL